MSDGTVQKPISGRAAFWRDVANSLRLLLVQCVM